MVAGGLPPLSLSLSAVIDGACMMMTTNTCNMLRVLFFLINAKKTLFYNSKRCKLSFARCRINLDRLQRRTLKRLVSRICLVSRRRFIYFLIFSVLLLFALHCCVPSLITLSFFSRLLFFPRICRELGKHVVRACVRGEEAQHWQL